MARDEALFIISSRGLRKYEKILQMDQRDVAQSVQAGMAVIGEETVFAMQNHAPFREGTMSDAIQVLSRNRQTARPNVTVGIDTAALGPFNYVNVTRFGRKSVEAKGRSTAAKTYSLKHLQNRRLPVVQNRPFRSRMLRFEPGPPGSGFVLKRRVRAYRPGSDWLKKSELEVKVAAAKVMNDITDEIDALFRTGRARGRSGGGRAITVKRRTRSGRMG